MKSIDLNSLAWFCKIVEEGSIQAASLALSIPAPTLSRHLKNLEQKLGVKLLNRSAHMMELTQEGQRYYHALNRNIEAIDEALLQLESDNLALTGSIKISAPNAMTRSYLNNWLLEFMQIYPGVLLTVMPAVSDYQAIEDGIDLALVVYPSQQADWVQRQILSTASCVLASPEYLTQHGKPNVPTELENHALLGSNAEHEWSFSKQDKMTQIVPRLRYTCGDIHNVLAACIAGIGITCIPMHFAKQHLDDGRLVRLFTDYALPDQGLYMTYPDRILLPLRVRRLIEFLTEKYQQEMLAVRT